METSSISTAFRFVATLYIVLLIGTVELLGRYFPQLNIPQWGYLLPFFAPVAVSIIITALAARSTNGNRRLEFTVVDIGFVVTLMIWLIIELLSAVLKDATVRPTTIANFFWTYIAFKALQSLGCTKQKSQLVIHIFLFVIVILVGSQLVLEFVYSATAEWETKDIILLEVRDNNYICYLAVFATGILINEPSSRFKSALLFIVILPLTILLLKTEGSRGAFLVFVAMTASGGGGWLYKQIGMKALPVLAGSLALLALWQYEKLYELLAPTIAGLTTDYISYHDEIGESGGDMASAMTRYKTILLAFKEFAHSPIFGLGSEELDSIKVLDLGLHSNLLIPLFSYGVLGGLPFFLTILLLAIQDSPQGVRIGLFYCITLILALLFQAEFHPWLSIIFYVGLAQVQRSKEEASNKSASSSRTA